MNRWSIVRDLKLNSVGQASIVQIGDNEIIEPKVRVMAVQRSLPYFLENEGNFEYPIFSREIPVMKVYEKLDMSIDNSNSAIQVGSVKVVAIAASSVLQVGTNEKIQAESRIKHFRQYVTDVHSPNTQ